MRFHAVSLIALTFIFHNVISEEVDIYSCPRIHKAWHLSTPEEKQLFIKGVHLLNDQGKIARFAQTHQNRVDSMDAHMTSEFFPWHRYLLWEFENQIRSLGEDFKCFATPYWDISHDAGETDDAYVFRSGLGGKGEVSNLHCVDTADNGAWSPMNYPLIHVCHEEIDESDNVINGCCLKRDGGLWSTSSTATYASFIKSDVNYGTESSFRADTFRNFHGEAHCFVGGTFAANTHMISRFAPADPLFWMTHSWFDYIFVVWKNCWGYNQIASADLDAYPRAYYSFPDNGITATRNGVTESGLDNPLLYAPMVDAPWWQGDEIIPSPRKMWDETHWDFQYERGQFLSNSKLGMLCTNEWDDQVLLENSKSTKEIISSNAEKEVEQTELEKYTESVWEKIELMMKNPEYQKIYDEKNYLQTWDAKTCNYQRQKLNQEPCYVPIEIEECSEDDDEELTLEYLLSKGGVADNSCLEEIRIKFYGYAKSMNKLYDLCNGKFDSYHACSSPQIDFLVDKDDEDYYIKIRKNKQRMDKEQAQKEEEEEEEEEINNNNLEKITNNIKKEIDVVENNSSNSNNNLNNDIFFYIVIAFLIFGGIFIAMMRRCTNKKNKAMEMNHQYNDESNYGSLSI